MPTLADTERFLHVGLHRTTTGANHVELKSVEDQYDLYSAFTQSAAATGLAWSRLDGSAPRTVQWGMNDAGFRAEGSEVAWVQVAPTVGVEERFPLHAAVLLLENALQSIAAVEVRGLHAVAPMEEFLMRPPNLLVNPLPSLRFEDEIHLTVSINATVDAQPSAVAEAAKVRSAGYISEVVDVSYALAPDITTASGLWRLYADPARVDDPVPVSYQFTCVSHYGDLSALSTIAESSFASLSALRASGPAHVMVALETTSTSQLPD